MLSTHYDRRHRLMVLGYLDEDGKLKPEYRPSEAAKAAGGFCRVDLTSVHGLPPQAVRALAALSDRCNRDKRSRARVPTLARASGRSVRAWHRAFIALAVAGWAWSRGRCRGLGREQVRADSGKRHTPFRRMAHFISSSRERQKESNPAGPGGCDTLIQCTTANRTTADSRRIAGDAARCAGSGAGGRQRMIEVKVSPFGSAIALDPARRVPSERSASPACRPGWLPSGSRSRPPAGPSRVPLVPPACGWDLSPSPNASRRRSSAVRSSRRARVLPGGGRGCSVGVWQTFPLFPFRSGLSPLRVRRFGLEDSGQLCEDRGAS